MVRNCRFVPTFLWGFSTGALSWLMQSSSACEIANNRPKRRICGTGIYNHGFTCILRAITYNHKYLAKIWPFPSTLKLSRNKCVNYGSSLPSSLFYSSLSWSTLEEDWDKREREWYSRESHKGRGTDGWPSPLLVVSSTWHPHHHSMQSPSRLSEVRSAPLLIGRRLISIRLRLFNPSDLSLSLWPPRQYFKWS